MSSIADFVAACAFNPDDNEFDIYKKKIKNGLVQQMISDGVEVGQFDICLENMKEVMVLEMISAGVNVNGLHDGFSGLSVAMTAGNVEVVKILLGCQDIKIDLKTKHGMTALHFACLNNQAECVKLFLAHPTCSKDIVRIVDENGATAEKIADKRGNKECSKLVRKFTASVQEDERSVDDLVEFITRGEMEKKKSRKKRNNRVKSATHVVNTGNNIHAAADTGAKDGESAIETRSKNDSDPVEGLENTNIRVDSMKRTKLMEVKEELEEKIAEKSAHLDAHEQNAKNVIETMLLDSKNLLLIIGKAEEEKNTKLNEIDKLDKWLSDLETKMAELKLKKAELKLKKAQLLEESKNDDKKILNYEDEKHKLNIDFEKA